MSKYIHIKEKLEDNVYKIKKIYQGLTEKAKKGRRKFRKSVH